MSENNSNQKQSFHEKATFVVHKVEKIRFDNRLFRQFREIVYRHDNAIFNRKGSAGPGYQPTLYSMILPFWSGVMAGIYVLWASFTDVEKVQIEHNFWIGALIMLAINLALSRKKVCSMPGLMRKIFYPIFIAFWSLACYFILVLMINLAAGFIGLLFILLIVKGGLSSAFGSMSSGGNNYAPAPVTEEKWLDDGSAMGVRISREGGVGDWQGNDGNRYTEDGSGQFRKK